MNNLKIAFVTNNYYPYHAGVVNSIDSFKKELESNGHAVNIFTLDFKKDFKDSDCVKRLWCPIKFNFRGNSIAIPFFAQKQLLKMFKEFQPDVIHIHHPFLLGQAALNVAKKMAIPVVFTYHSQYEIYADHYFPSFSFLTKPLIKKRLSNLCKSVDAIIAPSKSVANNLLNFNEKTSVISSGIADVFFVENFLKKNEKNKYNLISVGRFVSEKNIEKLIDLISILDDKFSLTLVGFGHLLNSLKEYAFQIKNISENRIKFIVDPTKNELIKLYRNSDIFVFASQSETQGLVIIEAMASSCAVVAFDGPGICDVIKSGHNGVLVKTVDHMKEAVEILSTTSIFYDSVSCNGWLESQNFKISITTDQLLKIYKKVLTINN